VQNFLKIPPEGSELFLADRNNETHSRFLAIGGTNLQSTHFIWRWCQKLTV